MINTNVTIFRITNQEKFIFYLGAKTLILQIIILGEKTETTLWFVVDLLESLS